MSQEKLSAHVSRKKSFLWLLLSLMTATVIVFSQCLQVALAGRPPDDPGYTPPVEIGDPPPFAPVGNGFDWTVPSRFGRDDNQDGLIDYHWDSENFVYEQSLLYPESWPITFYGCRTKQDDTTGVSTSNTYTWQVNGETISGHKCWFTYDKDSPNTGNLGFPALGTYPVTLTVNYGNTADSPTGQNPETFSQVVVVRDILIVSMGDSFASGESIPDIPQKFHISWGFPVWDADAVWQDKRCHRSANAGPALAALAIERMDPKTSVTFISFACSGSTIGTELFDGLGGGDANQSRGTGVLGPYKGQDVPEPYNYSNEAEGWQGYIPSQMTQLKNTLIPPNGKPQRQIDSLLISGGGNDMHFAGILSDCVVSEFCWDAPNMYESPDNWTLYSPHTLVNRALGIVTGRSDNVPKNYQDLAAEIGTIVPAPLKVYVTQYPNLGTGDDGGYCRMLDDVLWPNPLAAIDPWETEPALEQGLKALNRVIFQAAKSQGWVYVDGLANYKLDDNNPDGPNGLFYRHGYCAFDHWITRAEESELRQGPLYIRAGTSGTAHPNILGTQAYSTRILHYMVPNLFPQQPANPPAIGAPSYSINGLVDVPGANGWYLGSCQDGACYPKVVMQVVGSADEGVAGAGVTINSVDACSLSGVVCRTDGGLSTDQKQYTWNMELSADGIYDIQFNLRDSTGAVANSSAQIKVDLHAPQLVPPGPFTVDEGGTVALQASVTDNAGGSVSFTWDLDNDGEFETYDQQPVFSAAGLDGPSTQAIQVKATDQAGRTATASAEMNVANVAPSVAIIEAPIDWFEGTPIILKTWVSDPGAADTFTYDWSVKKDGIDYTTGTGSPFSFTPLDNGSYEVSLIVTDDDGGVGTDSKTIGVYDVVPSAKILDAPADGQEGSAISLRSSVTDPSPVDTFTYAWLVMKNGIDYASGSEENFSFTPDDDGSYVVSLSVTDDDNGTGTAPSQTIAVTNVAPSLTITSPADGTLYTINTSVSLTGAFSDAGTDSISCSVVWGDGTTTTGTLSAGACTASHSFTAANVYTVQMTVADDDSGSTTQSVMVVVYDPSAGFVTGGGWINSVAGAYKPDPSLSGKANFGFVSKYQKGQTVPAGTTAFTFQVGGFEFASTAYEWLVVNQAGTNAQFKGTGLVNGGLDGNGHAYKFMIWAVDGSLDTFRIRIWWEDAAGEHAVYDNGVAQAIGGGNIVVHTSK